MNTFPCVGLKAMVAPPFGWFHWKGVLGVEAEFVCCCCGGGGWSTVEFSGEEGILLSGEGVFASTRFTVVMSWMLALRLSFPPECCLMKYFCAWLATWVGVLVITKLREIFLQSPLPYFFSPIRNNLQAMIKIPCQRRSERPKLTWITSKPNKRVKQVTTKTVNINTLSLIKYSHLMT